MTDLEGLMDNAQEAETDPDRHLMEEAILATLATADSAGQDQIAIAAESITCWRSDFGAIAAAMLSSLTEGTPIEKTVIKNKLRAAIIKVEVKDNVLTDILAGTEKRDVFVALAYIKRINALDKWRDAETLGQHYLSLIEKAKEEGRNIDAFVADLAGKVFDLATGKKLIRDHLNEADAAEGFLDELNTRQSDGRTYIGLESGFRHLDEILNGLKEGLIILAAPPSLGKTTLAKQIADHVAVKEKVPVLFYSFEQSAAELRIKSFARMASVDSRVIEKGRTDPEAWKRVEEAEREYRQGPGPYLKIIEGGRSDTVEAIRAAAIMAQRKAGSERILLVIDYLQIIPGGSNARDALRERIDMILTDLRRLARDLKSPVIVISSMNRKAYTETGHGKIFRPTMTSMKESGGIEFSADVVIALWKDKEESERLTRSCEGRTTDFIEARILKNRNGENNKTVKLTFTKAWSMFDEEGGVGTFETDPNIDE